MPPEGIHLRAAALAPLITLTSDDDLDYMRERHGERLNLVLVAAASAATIVPTDAAVPGGAPSSASADAADTVTTTSAS